MGIFFNYHEQPPQKLQDIPDGFAYHKIVLDDSGSPVDCIILNLDNSYELFTGYSKEQIIGKLFTDVLTGLKGDLSNYIGEYGRVALTCGSYSFEYYSQSVNRWYSVFVFSHELLYFTTVFRDITNTKNLVSDLKKVSYLNEILLDAIPHPALLIHKDRTVIAANKIAKEAGTIIGGFCWRDWGGCLYINDDDHKRKDIFKPGTDPTICCYFCKGDTALEINEPVNIKIKLGEIFWDVFWVPTKEEGVYLHYAIDITDQKKIEYDLRESELRFKHLTEATFEGIAILSKGVIIDNNKRMELMFGYNSAELAGMPISNLISMSFEEWNPGNGENTPTGSIECFGIKQDGTKFRVEVLINSTYYKGNRTAVFVVRDISKNKSIEESFEKVINILSDSQNMAHIGNLEYDVATRKVYWSDELYRMLGYKEQEFVSKIKTYAKHISPDDRNQINKKIRERTILDSTFRHECSFTKNDGSKGWISIKGDIDFNKLTLEPVRIFAIVQDVTEKKQAEIIKWEHAENLKLLQQEKQYREIVEMSPLIVIFESEGTIKYINYKGVEKLGGVKKDQFIGKLIKDFLVFDNEQENNEGTVKCLNGTDFEFSAVSSTVLFEGRETNQLIIDDITERRKAEERKRLNEKVMSLGVMAAGIAHEINQPLNSLKVKVDGTLYLIDKGIIRTDKKMVEKLDYMSQDINSIDKIIKYLHSLLRTEPKIIDCDLQKIIDQTIMQFANESKLEGICITKNFCATPLVKASPVGLQQAIYNITKNAIYAVEQIEGYKEISFSTKLLHDRVVLEISNNGPGVKKEIRDKIFDPFFTTKEQGHGIGLGLSLTHSSIQAMGGDIYLDSATTIGAKFVIELQYDNSLADQEEKEPE